MSAQAPAVPAGTDAPPKKSKKKLFLILALVLLLAGGGGAYYFLAKPAAEEAEDAEEEEEPKQAKGKKTDAKSAAAKKETEKDKKKKKKKKKETGPVEFMTIEPWFTFNLMDKDPERSGQIGLVFELTGKKTAEALKFRMPVVRSRILFLVSGKYSTDLKSPEGKEKLQEEILAATRSALDPEVADGVENVHFSIFVVQ